MFLSTDQFIFTTPGQLPTVYFRDLTDHLFQESTTYKNAASVLIWIGQVTV